MIIWVAAPCLEPDRAEEFADRWHERGYRVAIVMNREKYKPVKADVLLKVDAYEGYYRTLNFLCQGLVQNEKADVVVCAGDRVRPPALRGAHEIGTTFAARFQSGIGVMQPGTGAQALFDRENCPSPWIGCNFIRKFYGGKGPFHEGYFQFHGGKELFAVAQKAGLLWQRDDIHQEEQPIATPSYFQNRNREEYYNKDLMHFKERELYKFEGAEAGQIIVASSMHLPRMTKLRRV